MIRQLKIFFFMWDYVGPQNACLGLGQALKARGHQVYFIVNEAFADKFHKYGFEMRLLKEDPSRKKKEEEEEGVDPIKAFCEVAIKHGLFDNLSSVEKLRRFHVMNFFEETYLKNLDYEPQIKQLLEQEKPDFLVLDCDILAPSLLYCGIPWANLFCSQPLGIFNSDDLPPFCSGYPVKGDRKQWEEFRKVQKEYHFGPILKYQKQLCDTFNYPFDEKQTFNSQSPYLNIYQYPEELDYHNDIKIPDHFLRVDAFCREEVGEFKLPEKFVKKITPGSKLIYVSMGSMGSCDIKLMKRLVALLAKTPHFYIVSCGLMHDQYELADNMWGDVHVPQTQVLPLVDLYLTHGGNNSVTEGFSFGVPMICLPMAYDQYDNAQRLDETGYGVRLNTYEFRDEELLNAIDRLLNDHVLKEKLTKAAERIRNTNSKLRACIAIENVCEKAAKSKK